MRSSIYRRYGISMAQVWFCDEVIDIHNANADIILYNEVKSVHEKYRNHKKVFTTVISDLSIDEKELYSGISKTYRYEIKRASRENIFYKIYFNNAIFEEKKVYQRFVSTYNKMYRDKGLSSELNERALRGYAESGMICLSVAYVNSEPSVFHSYIYDDSHVRLYQSASDFRGDKSEAMIIGMANKGLHWSDIIYFKNDGIKEYDWGGISAPSQPNGIDKFKLCFGGIIVTRYNVFRPLTLAGRLVCRIKRF